jgi:hypothetical protein
MFESLARPGDPESEISGGWLHAGGGAKGGLRLLTSEGSLYEVDAGLRFRLLADPRGVAWMRTNAAIPRGVLSVDAASVIYRDRQGTWRLPKGDPSFDAEAGNDRERVCREVCTERDLFNAHGTFYELPAENAGGAAGLRPVTTHNRHVRDYATYRGLLFLSGVRLGTPARDPRVIRSEDGRGALWVGQVEDLWRLGKPRGRGGPWKDTAVEPGRPSDPYLMTGYDRKTLTLAHDAAGPVAFELEVDITGRGTWVVQERFEVPAKRELVRRLPDGLSAYWARFRAGSACRATAQFVYE